MTTQQAQAIVRSAANTVAEALHYPDEAARYSDWLEHGGTDTLLREALEWCTPQQVSRLQDAVAVLQPNRHKPQYESSDMFGIASEIASIRLR